MNLANTDIIAMKNLTPISLRRTGAVLTLLFTIIAAACSPAKSVSLAAQLPASDGVPGWTLKEEPRSFVKDNLYDLVDGQADAFFAYGFETMSVGRYQNSESNQINVEIWQLNTPASAFGLFSANLGGEAVSIGVEGSHEPGRRLAFWQDRYYVAITANKPVEEATLWAYGEQISKGLPTGGERPAILQRLPAEDRVERSELFFHEELSAQNEIWMGGQNVLGLSQETDGVISRYTSGDETLYLLIVQYPKADAAAAAVTTLQAADLDDLAAVQSSQNLLAAVFGQASETDAQALINAALKE